MDTEIFLNRVHELFTESIETHRAALPYIAESIAVASQRLYHTVLSNQKILVCGNGGSASDAQHFAAELINRFEVERPGLPAIALTTDSSNITSIANDSSYAQIFARQIQALGLSGDMLLAISTSGNSENIVTAIEMAQQKQMHIILLSGRNGGEAVKALGADDMEIRVPAESTARIQEVHILVLHCLCDLLDKQLLGF